MALFAVPPDSQFIQPKLLDGRWLQPGDSNALVANIDLSANEPDIAVGETVQLRVNGRAADWEVVGIVTPQLVGAGEPRPENPIAYVPYAYFATENRLADHVNRLNVAAEDNSASAQTALTRRLSNQFSERGIHLRNSDTNAHTRILAENLTMPVLLLLISMAFLFALVGGLSLMGTMSLNVLERTQEIGVIRSIGATGAVIMQIVVIEGVFVGLISWLFSVLLAYPMGWLMSTAVGISFIKVPLTYQFAPLGIFLWLGVVIVLAAIASVLPARNASRLVVREALAYE
jgi:putative ABC transport system permease protein